MTEGKAYLLAFLTLLLGFLAGIFIWDGVCKKKLEEEIRKVDVRKTIRMRKIERLREENEKLDSAIREKKEYLDRIDTLWMVEKEKILTLPLDSSVLLLRQNLENYEWEDK